MKVTKNHFELHLDQWEDPGSYPNGVAGGPLPSYSFVEDIEGEMVVELEGNNDYFAALATDEDWQRFAKEKASIPSTITITKWNITREGNKVIFEVGDFDASKHRLGDDDYESDYYD